LDEQCLSDFLLHSEQTFSPPPPPRGLSWYELTLRPNFFPPSIASRLFPNFVRDQASPMLEISPLDSGEFFDSCFTLLIARVHDLPPSTFFPETNRTFQRLRTIDMIKSVQPQAFLSFRTLTRSAPSLIKRMRVSFPSLPTVPTCSFTRSRFRGLSSPRDDPNAARSRIVPHTQDDKGLLSRNSHWFYCLRFGFPSQGFFSASTLS